MPLYPFLSVNKYIIYFFLFSSSVTYDCGCMRVYIKIYIMKIMKLPFFYYIPSPPPSPSYTYNNNRIWRKKGSILSSTKTLLFCSIFVCVFVCRCSLLLFAWYLIHYEILFLTHSLFFETSSSSMSFSSAILYCHQEPYHQRCWDAICMLLLL